MREQLERLATVTESLLDEIAEFHVEEQQPGRQDNCAGLCFEAAMARAQLNAAKDALAARPTPEPATGAAVDVLRRLVNALGHDTRCSFTGCDCGAMNKQADALNAANRLLRAARATP